MTQGWRRFNMTAKGAVVRHEAEKGLRVSGKVLTPLKSPATSTTVNLIVGDGSHGIFSTKTNEKGEFVFDSLYFEGPNTLRLTAANSKGKSNLNLVLDTLIQQPVRVAGMQSGYALEQIPDSAILTLTGEAEVKRLLRVAQIEKMQLLDEVKVSAHRVNKINESQNINTSPALYSLPEKHFEQYSNMKDALESKIPSLVFNGNLMKFRNDSISIFIDGVPMDRDFRVRDINTADVAGLEVLTGAQSALYGRKAILFVTLKSGMTKSSASMGQATLSVKGYGFSREFYSPRFDNIQQKDLIDTRKTIYWNPNLLTRDGISPEFSFFTGNEPGRYRFIIEGIDEFGNVFRKVFSREIR